MYATIVDVAVVLYRGTGTTVPCHYMHAVCNGCFLRECLTIRSVVKCSIGDLKLKRDTQRVDPLHFEAES